MNFGSIFQSKLAQLRPTGASRALGSSGVLAVEADLGLLSLELGLPTIIGSDVVLIAFVIPD